MSTKVPRNSELYSPTVVRRHRAVTPIDPPSLG
jgi:hypothetical protein